MTRQGPRKVQPAAAAVPASARRRVKVHPDTLTWCRAYRLSWIRDALAVYGFINRDHLRRKFGISRPQASADLTLFARQHPALVRYNASAKRYEARRQAR